MTATFMSGRVIGPAGHFACGTSTAGPWWFSSSITSDTGRGGLGPVRARIAERSLPGRATTPAPLAPVRTSATR